MRGVFFLLIIFILQSCGETGIPLTKPIPSTSFDYANGWYSVNSSVLIDTDIKYKGNNSLLLFPEGGSLEKIIAFYYLNLSEIEGDFITFSGKYKFQKNNNTKLYFTIKEFEIIAADSVDFNLKPDTWHDFSVTCPLNKIDYAFFNIILEGDNKVWINDCNLKINGKPIKAIGFDAEKDVEFDTGSKITLSSLTPQMAENLYILGKVWGFLKYYHPEVTKGKYNWDYELFRVLPKIAEAGNKEERNEQLKKWIDKYGAIKEKTDYTIKDSTQYSRFINLTWLTDTLVFDNALINKLESIKNAKRSSKLNYYWLPYAGNKTKEGKFDREKSYSDISWEDQGFRLLTLFRLWNVIEYCFPYRDYTDTPWDSVLIQFIPDFVSINNKNSYALLVKQLAANINDSHASLSVPDSYLQGTILEYRKNRPPVELIQSEEGYLAIKSTECKELKRGDLLLKIENKNINDVINEMRPYTIASNYNGNIDYNLLATNDTILTIEILRKGDIHKIRINNFKSNKQKETINSYKYYNLASKNIIYIDNVNSAEENKRLVENNMNSRGIIIDMRQYPGKHNQIYMPALLLPRNHYPLWISKNDKKYPGNYLLKKQHIIETENPGYYKGKVAILVDEHTQSAGETWAMYLRESPKSAIIGRQSAGANGNVSYPYPLPHGFTFRFTALGAYYPNWEQMQRKGLKIDISANPTVKDIAEAKDVWIKKAIEYIMED